MRVRATAALLAAGLAVAGCGHTLPPASTISSERPVLSLDELEAQPIELREETVAMAFDRGSAAALLEEVPDEVDFATHAVVCVFLGPRQTTGWSLDLRSASLSGRELRIRAREMAPRAGTRPVVTYPADCGLMNRAALPVGEIAVRADDTITDEFIADAVVDVPEPSTSP